MSCKWYLARLRLTIVASYIYYIPSRNIVYYFDSNYTLSYNLEGKTLYFFIYVLNIVDIVFIGTSMLGNMNKYPYSGVHLNSHH